MNRQDFYYDQLVKQMDLDLLQDNAERGIGVGLVDTFGTGLSSIAIIAHENGTPDMDALVPAGSARVQETGTISTVGTLTNGSAIITDIPNTARLSKGDDFSGVGVPGSTKILTVDGINQITMDKNATADGSAIDLTATYIKYTRAVWITEETIDCSVDWQSASTIPAAGKECYIACYVKQNRDLYDQRQDGFDPPNTIYYRQIEGAEFRVYKGADANPGNAVKVSSPGDEFELVFEVLFDENTTTISDAVDKYIPIKDEIDYTDVVFLRSQELKDALNNFLSLSDKFKFDYDKIKAINEANYIILDYDNYSIIEVTTGAGDRTITLPTLADNLGRVIIINKIDNAVGEVIVDGEGAETIDGLLSIQLRKQNYSIKLYASSTEWNIIATDNELKKARRNIKALSGANYVITDVDGVEIISIATGAADRTITLPTLADNQERIFEIYKEDFTLGDVIIDGEGSETINGGLTVKLPRQYSKIKIIADANEWKILSMYHPVADTGWINRTDWTDVHLGSAIVNYDNLVGTFDIGEVVTEIGGAGATGVIVADSGTVLKLEQVTNGGIFANDNNLTGADSGATAKVNEGAGSSINKDEDMNHLLDANLSELRIKLLLSTDGTEGNAWIVLNLSTYADGATNQYGAVAFAVDTNNFYIQTGAHGIQHLDADGLMSLTDTDNFYYKIVVFKEVI